MPETKNNNIKKQSRDDCIYYFENRISSLEGAFAQEQRSIEKKFGIFGAGVALIVSFLSAGILLYDYIVLKPRESRAKELLEIDRIVQRITHLNRALSDIQRGGDAGMLAAQTSIANGEKISLSETALRLISKNSEGITSPHMLVIGGELLNYGNINGAKEIFYVAIERANTPLLKSESYRYMGMAFFAEGSDDARDRGREFFDKAVTELSSLNRAIAAPTFVQTMSNWIYLERMRGECDFSKELWNRMVSNEMVGSLSAKAVNGITQRIDSNIYSKKCN